MLDLGFHNGQVLIQHTEFTNCEMYGMYSILNANYGDGTRKQPTWLKFENCTFKKNLGTFLFALTSMSYNNYLYTTNCLFEDNTGGIISLADESTYTDVDS